MKMVYVPSAIRKPFSFIDHSIIQAMKKIGLDVSLLRPGTPFEKEWVKLRKKGTPDFLLVMLGERLTLENLQLIQTFPFPKAIWYTDDPYAIDRALKSCAFFDWVFTNESVAVPVYQRNCQASVSHLALAAPDSYYLPLKKVSPMYRSQLVLVGSAFQNRMQTVMKLSPYLKKFRTRLVGPGWYRLSSSTFSIRKGWIEPEEVCRYYNGAHIVLNIHRSFHDPYLKQNKRKVRAETPNNRLFEIAACASFQIMDHRRDLNKYFEPAKEIVTYGSLEELKEKIAFYLPRKQLRQKIAQQAYQRTLKEHLYEHRIQEMLSLIFPKKHFFKSSG